MKRESFVFLMLLLFQSIGVVLAGNELTVPVDGEALYNVVFTAQKQNQDGEAMLINALSKIYVKDVLKVTPVNAKGDRGTGVQPDIEIKGDTIKLRLGALLEFDLEKYKNGVLSPLQDVLKKVSLNGGERIDAKLYQKYQEKELRVNQQSWEYGNIQYKLLLTNTGRFRWDTRSYAIILNVLPVDSNIIGSTFEAYKLQMSNKLANVFKTKILEATNISAHFVFKDEMDQEVFHKICAAMERNFMSSQPTTFYPLFFYNAGTTLERELPMVISPEIYGGDYPLYIGQDKWLFVCQFEANSSEVKRIKSYEIYLEESTKKNNN